MCHGVYTISERAYQAVSVGRRAVWGKRKFVYQNEYSLSQKPEQVAKYTAKEDSIKNVTITNVLLDQYYNDVGFQIGEKLIILVEQQSLCKDLHKDCYV